MMSSFIFLVNVNIHHYTMTTLGLCYLSLKKTSQFPEIIWNQSYYMAPIFQHLPSARSKIFFSEPVLFRPHTRNLRTISPQTPLLIGYCLLSFVLSHCFKHTVACNTFVIFCNESSIYVCKVRYIFRVTFSERFAYAPDVHNTLLTERMSWVEYLRPPFLFQVAYYCLTKSA